MLYDSISARELDAKIKNGDEINLIDVREPIEFEIARIEGASLLPLSRFREWIDELEPEKELIIMCHHGVRSAQVCMYLKQKGFEKVFNLEGGIDSWTLEVDENVPRY